MKKLLCVALATFVSFTVQAKAITAKSFLVADNHGEILAEKNPERTQPIASITKLMTVMVVLNARQDLSDDLNLEWKLRGRYHTRLPRYLKTLTRGELVQLAIVKSDNFAAYTLCQNYPGGVENCVLAMNREAARIGMRDTYFTDPTGLDRGNVSNARDLVKLVLAAHQYSEITAASSQAKVSITARRGHAEFGNTNPMVRMGEDVIVSKTGYINSSGGCIVMMLNTREGPRVVVVLGSRNTRTRIPEAKLIMARL